MGDGYLSDGIELCGVVRSFGMLAEKIELVKVKRIVSTLVNGEV